MADQKDIKERNAKLMRAATLASVSVAASLIVIKTFAWLLTDSVALLSTLMDSLLDMAASLVSFFAVRHALTPADREHRFGHGKAESLAGLAQAAFISGSAVFLVLEAGERLLNPKAIANTDIGVAVMAAAVVATLVLVAFQRYVVKRTGSVAIKADSLHYQTDLLVNISVAVSLLLSANLDWTWADPVFALAIAAYIVRGAWVIAAEALTHLMDKELPDESRQRIIDIALADERVLGVHDLRTRSSGAVSFIQFHIELGRDLGLVEAHEIADDVMGAVHKAFPNSQVLIHQDPHGIAEPRDTFDAVG